MYYLTSSEGVSGEGPTVGSGAAIRINATGGARASLGSALGEQWIPEQQGGLQGLVLTIPGDIGEPGVYDIVADEVLSARVALNGHPSESDLKTMDADQLQSMMDTFGGGPVTVLESEDVEFSAIEAGTESAGTEIWNVFLAVALLFLVVEMLVAKR
jgi:hypothetical protein